MHTKYIQLKYTYMCIYIHTGLHTNRQSAGAVAVYIYVYIHTYTYMCIYIHTGLHTNLQSAGAVAVFVYNDVQGAPFSMADSPLVADVAIPSGKASSR